MKISILMLLTFAFAVPAMADVSQQSATTISRLEEREFGRQRTGAQYMGVTNVNAPAGAISAEQRAEVQAEAEKSGDETKNPETSSALSVQGRAIPDSASGTHRIV